MPVYNIVLIHCRCCIITIDHVISDLLDDVPNLFGISRPSVMNHGRDVRILYGMFEFRTDEIYCRLIGLLLNGWNNVQGFYKLVLIVLII